MGDTRLVIRALQESDADAYVALRRAALLDSPLAFKSSPESDRAGSVEAVRQQLRHAPDSVIFGAFTPTLVGSAGLYRDSHAKASHKAHLWGMYVAPAFRRQGVAAALLRAAREHAQSLPGVEWIHLGVSSAAPGAQRLYERAGFEIWGAEPDALRHDGHSETEYHMGLRLSLDPG